jgi:hypothetical protein
MTGNVTAGRVREHETLGIFIRRGLIISRGGVVIVA